jgi:predicted permease
VGEISFEGREAPNGAPPVVGVRVNGGEYFQALRIPVRAGRAFDSRDRPDSIPAVLVNATMAARFWPGESPVGKRIAIGLPAQTWRMVEGVVGDVSHDGIDAAPLPEAYLPLAQSAEGGLSLVLRCSRDPGGLAGILRSEVASLDPDLPLYELRPMEDRISDALAQPRFLLEAFSGFAALTLLLSALALFTLVAHDVGQRRREVGIRMALGARSADIVRLFVSRVAALIAIGVGLGLAAALALTRLLVPALHGTRPDDPGTLVAAAGVLAAVALLAAGIPARRATRHDPIGALKHE